MAPHPAPWFSTAVRIGWGLCLGLGLGLGAATAGTQSLTLAVSRAPLSLPLYIAETNGYFKAEGLDVRLAECVGGNRCLREVLDGHADVATVGDLPIVMGSFASADFAILATFVKASDDVKLIANARSGVTRAAQLGGKRIGIVKGTASEYFLELSLLTAGVDPKTTAVVDMKPEDMAAALQSGKLDAVAVWEPFAHLMRKSMGADARVVPVNGAYILTFNLVSHRRLVGQRDGDLVKLLRAMQRAEQFIQTRPQEAKKMLLQRLALEQDFVDAVWPGLRFRLVLDQSLLSAMEGEARWARREGHATGGLTPDFSKLVHPAPLRTVKPEAVTIHR